jgi:hypothetical protein
MMNQEEDCHISKKKIHYPISITLLAYLTKYNRALALPLSYEDLMRFDEVIPLRDLKLKKDTLWNTALYSSSESTHIFEGLKQIYSILKTGGDTKVHKHLQIERVDYCTFGNSHPFRVKIVNNFNDVYDYFYIKRADSSRVFGLELEDMLSPSRINFFATHDCLVEEHIPGIPGDVFIAQHLLAKDYNQKRIAKEFVKFNERCFVRLLGDMRSYNYVLDITPDFEDAQFRIRAIDFDQQCYEGRKNVYLPQFFKENKVLVDLVQLHFNAKVVQQYQSEERTLIARRIVAAKEQLTDLFAALQNEPLAPLDKITDLQHEIEKHFKLDKFSDHQSMSEIVKRVLEYVVDNYSSEKVKLS